MSYLETRSSSEVYVIGRLAEFAKANNIVFTYSSDNVSGLKIHMTRKWAQFIGEIDSLTLLAAKDLDLVIDSVIEAAKKHLRIKEE